MPGSIRLTHALGAVAGVGFSALLLATVWMVDPQRGVSDQELQTWWADGGNRNGFVASMYTLLLAGPLFLLFVSSLRARLRAAGAGDWADTVFGFGVVATAALGVCAVTRGVVASSMRFDEPLPGVDTLRFQTDLAYGAWDLAILFMAVMVAAASILALATRALPRWLGWLGVPVAAGGAVLIAVHSAPLSIPLFVIWIMAHSVQLWRLPAAAAAATPAWRPDVSGARP